MKIKYVGDKPNTTTLGRTFFQGQPVNVSDEVFAKLKGNSHFAMVDDTPKRGPGRPKKVSDGDEN